jgi:replicative DNA helicase
MPLSQIATKARRLKYAGKLDLVIIDHLNFIGTDTKKENRTNEVSDITKRLKGLAKELNVPVICLCQLSRALESRPNKRPQLSDLRESGTIEQDADIVLMLYRDGYYTKDNTDKSAELIIGKQRGGKVGTINLIFTGDRQLFVEDVLQGVMENARMEDLPE